MAKKIKYEVGDMFQFSINDKGNVGYGRILCLDSEDKLPIIEVYKINSVIEELPLGKILNAEILMKIRCFDLGFKKNIWKIIGNCPVIKFEEPEFLHYDDYQEIYYLVFKGHRSRIKKEEISKEYIEYGIYGHEAVSMKTAYLLEQEKLL